MSIQITRNAKHSLIIDTPVMPAAGMMGFGVQYRPLINMEKLGAFVTNPITLEPWSPASGTRVVPVDSGLLIHTGLPNMGLEKVIKEYRQVWEKMHTPVIAHLVGTTAEHLKRAVEIIEEEATLSAIELGLDDDVTPDQAMRLVKATLGHAEKPILVRLPAFSPPELARACADAGAGALVVASAPRGTARDPRSGRLVRGRLYSPTIKPLMLRAVGTLARQIQDVPIIGAGGIHSPQDARDYLEAGAVAVQVDSVVWVQPRMLERIARDLGGMLVTRAVGAFPDEWHPDMGDTEFQALFGKPDKDKNVGKDS